MGVSINEVNLNSQVVDFNYQFSRFYRIFIVEQKLIIVVMNRL